VIRLLFLFGVFFSTLFKIEGQIVNRIPLDFTDVYVLKVKFSESLLQKKSCCGYKNDTKCNLYKIEITSVLYCPLNTVFDSPSLMKLEYLIAPIVYTDSLKSGVEFLITAMPSSSNKYIALTRLLNIEVLNNELTLFYHKHAYLSGLVKCKKKRKNLFDDFIITQSL
jgi:hypothetical protein